MGIDRKRLVLASLIMACASTALVARDHTQDPWSEQRYTKEDILASQELKAIQKQIDEGKLPKIQFDFDSDVIRPESYSALNLIADMLLKQTHVKLRITAHTCTIGTHEYNLELSRRRAKSVKSYLVKQGVPPPSIRFKGMSYDEPIADNSTEAGREKNRRVEFQIVNRDWNSVY